MHTTQRLTSLFALAALCFPGATASAAPRPKVTPAAPAIVLPAVPHYHLVRSIPLAGGLGWDYLTLDAASRRLYVTRSTHVDVFDVDSGFLIGQITQTNGVHGVALAPELGRGWASDGADGAVTVFDLATLTPLGRIDVQGMDPDCIIYDAATKRVFTFNGDSNDATAIDAVSGHVLGTIPLGGRPEFAVADGRGMVYDNLESTSEVVALDARALTLKSRWTLAPAEGPSGIAMDTQNRRLFSVTGNKMMAVSDPDAGKVVGTPAIGVGPDAALYDPFYGVALSSNGRDGTLTVVSEASPQTFTVTATVPTQVGARTMALDTKTHHVFLIAAQYIPLPADAVPGTRPAIVDGTVVLLEMAP